MLPATLADPPLTPSADAARATLRRELLDPAYNDQDVVQRILNWIQRRVDITVESASAVPALTWLAATLVAVALGAGLVLLLSRARLSARGSRDAARGVLTGEALSAAELRARAEQAMLETRYGDAVVEAFRALAVHQVERGRLDDAPGSTAREVAESLASQHPDQREPLTEGARLFDAVMYGERPATREEAVTVLGIDARLRSTR